MKISDRGYWIGGPFEGAHFYDECLAQALVEILLSSGGEVADFGCGLGEYVQRFNAAGVKCCGYDGNPETERLSMGLCQCLDLSQQVDLGKLYDCVLSLEVGEHIPPVFEDYFIGNIARHAKSLIIISWAIEGQPGAGHVNCRNNDYVQAQFGVYGWTSDAAMELRLRESASLPWFKKTIMVFRKRQ